MRVVDSRLAMKLRDAVAVVLKVLLHRRNVVKAGRKEHGSMNLRSTALQMHVQSTPYTHFTIVHMACLLIYLFGLGRC